METALIVRQNPPTTPASAEARLRALLAELQQLCDLHGFAPECVRARYGDHHPPFVSVLANKVGAFVRQAEETADFLRAALEAW
jgi:hypothetical protein